MANRQTRGTGQLARPQSIVGISDAPDFAVDTGAAGRVLESLGGSLSSRLSKMADEAAAREGAQAGMNAGQVAGDRYLQLAQGDAAAAARGDAPKPALVLPGQGSAGPAAIDGRPLQLRNDGTIRGDAFDAAALKAYSWRYETALSSEIAQAADANSDSPGGFEKALGDISQKYRGDLGGNPQLTELFDQTVTEKVAPLRLAIAARYQTRLKAEAKAAADQGTDSAAAELERSAYALGANPAADSLLAPSITRALSDIAAEVKDGTFTAKEGEAKKQALTAAVLNGRTQGTFDALPTPSAKQDFAKGIMDGWASGKGPYADLSLDQAKALSDRLYQKATVDANRLTAEQKAQGAQVKSLIGDDVASIAASGQGLDPAQSGLTADKVQLLLGQDGYDKWQADRSTAMQTFQATSGMELETPAELSDRLGKLQPKAGQAGFEDAQKIYATAVKHAQDILDERKSDPLGQANRGGLVTLKAIDTSTPDALVTSLQQRDQQARQVAQTYGTPLTIFRPEERQSLTTALTGNPQLLSAFARQTETALGPDAPTALGELSDAGPEIAHAAGLSLATGDNSVADDVARTIAGRQGGTFKAKMPTDTAMTDAAGTALGDVFSQNDAARSAVIGTANLLFEKDANTLGFDPAQVNKKGSAAQAAYSRAIDRALGGKTVAGVKYGGLVDVNGVRTVAPSFMPADDTEKLVTSMRDSDLAFLPPIQSGNGVPVRAADLRGAHLVAIGDGQYRVALGDPQSLDPRYVAAKGGGFWTLDLKQLATLHSLPDFAPDTRPIDLSGVLGALGLGKSTSDPTQ